jgi:sec-independent protein translocase protein TatA
MGLGVPELVVIFLIVIVLFGATRLPQIGRGLGEGISNFKRGLKGGNDPEQLPERLEEKRETR